MRYLTLEEVLILHSFQIEKFGGKPGILNAKLLESAVMRPQSTFSGKSLYKDVYTKASALAIGIIQNHPFLDGNKRTGMHAMLTFLELNSIHVSLSDKDVVSMGNKIAQKSISLKKLSKLLEEKS
ncbi:MAG: type II toxin-antitoxin system death-on-curing family toxin [Patescibacteria group bacterium]